MARPSPTDLAELIGISLVPGPRILKVPTLEEIVRLQEMYTQAIDEPEATFYRFASRFSAGYLFELVQTLLVLPRSLDGPSGAWWHHHVALLNILSPLYPSVYLQRFVRENEADALRLYVLVLDSLGALGHFSASYLHHKHSFLLNLCQLWKNLFHCLATQLPSLSNVPQLHRETLDGLAKLRDIVKTGGTRPFLPDTDRSRFESNIEAVLDPSFGESYKAYKEEAETGAWWECEAKSVANEGDPDLECVDCPEGACLTVRYCSRDHQRHHWKKHKKVCFKTEW